MGSYMGEGLKISRPQRNGSQFREKLLFLGREEDGSFLQHSGRNVKFGVGDPRGIYRLLTELVKRIGGGEGLTGCQEREMHRISSPPWRTYVFTQKRRRGKFNRIHLGGKQGESGAS